MSKAGASWSVDRLQVAAAPAFALDGRRAGRPTRAAWPAENTPASIVKLRVERWAARAGVPERLALAVAWIESGYQSDVRSRDGRLGPDAGQPAGVGFHRGRHPRAFSTAHHERQHPRGSPLSPPSPARVPGRAGDRADRSEPELTDLSCCGAGDRAASEDLDTPAGGYPYQSRSAAPSVWVKGQQIRQVLLNIIMNAVEALGGNKGVVTVSTSAVDMPDGRFVKLQVIRYRERDE